RSAAEKAWDQGNVRGAADAYLADLKAHEDDDTAWYNAGTAALAAGDPTLARASLSRAAASLDPELRFRALYNLGLLALLAARARRGSEGLVMLALLTVTALLQGAEVTASVDKTHLTVGEELVLTVRARSRSTDAVEIILPTLNGFAVVGSRDMTEVAFSGA